MSQETVLSIKDMVARKPHTCEQCGKVIPIGEKYRRQTGTYYDGELYSFATHLDCDEVWLKAIYQYASAFDDDLPFLKDYTDLEFDEEWIREDYPEVAARLFGEEEKAA